MVKIFNKRLKRGFVSLVEENIPYEMFLHPSSQKCVLILPADPNCGGSMDDMVVQEIFSSFDKAQITVMRISFAKHIIKDNQYSSYIAQASVALEELIKASQDMDNINPQVWIVGYSFGALISINLALRREISGFIAIAPPVISYDFFSWLAHAFARGLIIYGTKDEIVPAKKVESYASLLKSKNLYIQTKAIHGVGHAFSGKCLSVADACVNYVTNSEEIVFEGT